VTDQPTTADRSQQSTRWFTAELWLVFALTLGAEGLRSVFQLLEDATNGHTLASQSASIVTSKTGRPWFDLIFQLISIASGFVPVFLVWHFMLRSGEGLPSLGIDRKQPRFDLLEGAGIAAIIGGAGLGLYLGAHAAGVALTVVPENLPPHWWRIPILFLYALQNAALEEVLVLGFLLHRLRQLGWSDNRALAVSSVLRGSYHLYQGLGGFVGNAIMGVIFGRIFQRQGRVLPLVVAHTLMDSVAFIGYAELAGRVSWLPT
jgi:membrane protease YdiL (CAAX protease family)